MDNQIARLILSEQQISYALIDHDLIVRGVTGNPHTLWGYSGGDWADGRDGCCGLGRLVLHLLPELAGAEEQIDALRNGSGEILRLDSINRTGPAGETRYVNLALRSYVWPADGARGLLLVAQDVTEHGIVQQELMQRHNELRHLQERLERQNQELMATNAELRLMNEIRSSFISVAAHELRTPLTTVYGFLELLQENDANNLSSDQKEHLSWMEESMERLLNTLNGLLDAARIDSDRLELVLRPVPVADVIDEALLAFGPRIAARTQHLSVNVAPCLPQALCDPTRIEQVVTHLLSNASKFTPEGGTVGLSVRASDEGGFLHFSISDQGHGIANGDEDRLFQRFYRDQQVRKKGLSGAGLGLYITRSLVELHGGQVWYDSTPNQGSTFHFTIPAVDEPAPLSSSPEIATLPVPVGH